MTAMMPEMRHFGARMGSLQSAAMKKAKAPKNFGF
jgi:hypothetical protein